MRYIDVHAHLNDSRYGGDIAPIKERMKGAHVERVINSGFDYASSEYALKLSQENEGMYFCPGVHPDNAKTFSPEIYDKFKIFGSDPKCVAIGEIGFDFHWLASTEEEQERAFEKQMELADELGLPFVVHSRDATKKTVDFLQDRKSLINHGFLMHCYSDSAETAQIYLGLGAYFSFGGVITFKNAKKEEIIRSIPIDRVLSETDSPYLSPDPFRGMINEPTRIPLIVAKLASVYGKSVEETAEIINDNADRLFFKLCN